MLAPNCIPSILSHAVLNFSSDPKEKQVQNKIKIRYYPHAIGPGLKHKWTKFHKNISRWASKPQSNLSDSTHWDFAELFLYYNMSFKMASRKVKNYFWGYSFIHSFTTQNESKECQALGKERAITRPRARADRDRDETETETKTEIEIKRCTLPSMMSLLLEELDYFPLRRSSNIRYLLQSYDAGTYIISIFQKRQLTHKGIE